MPQLVSFLAVFKLKLPFTTLAEMFNTDVKGEH